MNALLMALLVAQSLLPVNFGYEWLTVSHLDKVVTIKVYGFNPDGKKMGALGSGAVISPDGDVLTCSHLFTLPLSSQTITVTDYKGYERNAILTKIDLKSDLGLLHIFPRHKLPYFKLGYGVVKGQTVLAYGSPLGLVQHSTVGIVENLVDMDLIHVIVHGAALNPGNSGGPLIDLHGRLVGVNVSILMLNMFMLAPSMNVAVGTQTIREFVGE